jgi:hypothetical protein
LKFHQSHPLSHQFINNSHFDNNFSIDFPLNCRREFVQKKKNVGEKNFFS